MRHLQSFKYIKAIVDAGSIRGAAESLTISPSALNRHIQTLEYDLDISLFDRLSRGVRLSPEGEIFYNFALNQMASYDRVRSHISSIRGKNFGSLRIGLSQDIDTRNLHGLVADFQRDLENVELSFHIVSQRNVYDLLKTRAVDMALMVNPRLRKGLKLLQAKDIELCAHVPVGTISSKSGTINLHQLDGMRIALAPHDSEVNLRVRAAIERGQLNPFIAYQGESVTEYLQYTHLPIVGIEAPLVAAEDHSNIPGYKRYALSVRDIGTCNISLITGEFFADTNASYRFQEMLNRYFD